MGTRRDEGGESVRAVSILNHEYRRYLRRKKEIQIGRGSKNESIEIGWAAEKAWEKMGRQAESKGCDIAIMRRTVARVAQPPRMNGKRPNKNPFFKVGDGAGELCCRLWWPSLLSVSSTTRMADRNRSRSARQSAPYQNIASLRSASSSTDSSASSSHSRTRHAHHHASTSSLRPSPLGEPETSNQGSHLGSDQPSRLKLILNFS